MVKISSLLGAALTVSFAAAIPIAKELESLEGSIGTFYSSDLTRNIFVKQIHSHNDYWRDVPLYTALSYGVQSVEADVWHYDNDDTIYVGHHQAALNSARTFQSLYIDPLVDILTTANPNNTFTETQTAANGVFDTDSTQTLYLFVDLKTGGEETWPYIVDALEPLRENGWLTTYNETGEITYGPVTVIGTGNTPYDYVQSHTPRDYFFDGPLQNLNSSYPVGINPIASADLDALIEGDIAPTGLNDTQLASVQNYIDTAHSLGIKTRIWDVAWWPVQKRDALWRQIIDAGSDFLNADDLAVASTFY